MFRSRSTRARDCVRDIVELGIVEDAFDSNVFQFGKYVEPGCVYQLQTYFESADMVLETLGEGNGIFGSVYIEGKDDTFAGCQAGLLRVFGGGTLAIIPA